MLLEHFFKHLIGAQKSSISLKNGQKLKHFPTHREMCGFFLFIDYQELSWNMC